MATLLVKLEVQGWNALFLQGDVQRKLGRPEVLEFYTNGVEKGLLFSSSV